MEIAAPSRPTRKVARMIARIGRNNNGSCACMKTPSDTISTSCSTSRTSRQRPLSDRTVFRCALRPVTSNASGVKVTLPSACPVKTCAMTGYEQCRCCARREGGDQGRDEPDGNDEAEEPGQRLHRLFRVRQTSEKTCRYDSLAHVQQHERTRCRPSQAQKTGHQEAGERTHRERFNPLTRRRAEQGGDQDGGRSPQKRPRRHQTASIAPPLLPTAHRLLQGATVAE